MPLPDESAVFAEAKNNGQPSDGLVPVYLVKLDGGETSQAIGLSTCGLNSRASPSRLLD